MRRSRHLLLLSTALLVSRAARADLLVSKDGSDVLVQHCDAHMPPVCTSADHLSAGQLRGIAEQVDRMTLSRLMTMAATLKAMPYALPPIRIEYGTFRRASESLRALVASSSGGPVVIGEADAGAEALIEVFDRAVAARAANPGL